MSIVAATKRADTALPGIDCTVDAYDPEVTVLFPTTTTKSSISTTNHGSNQDTANNTTSGGIFKYPNSNEVTRTDVHYLSVIHNEQLAFNLPDHLIHAHATTVVAVLHGKILFVANDCDSRAV